MIWCRLYNEFATDPKVQVMPEAMQRRLIMLFCLQSDGCLEAMDDETLACAMRLSASELQKTKELFTKKGFLEEGTWIPRNWEKRQRNSDDGNARVKRYRERKQRDSNGVVTLQKLKSNGGDTYARASAPALSLSLSPSVSSSGGSPEGDNLPAHSSLSKEPPSAEIEILTGRTGQDHADFLRAVEILKGHETTFRLGEHLSMQADLPEVVNFDGWQLIVAASVARRPNMTKSWNALMSYARQATLDEFDKLTKKLPPGTRSERAKPSEPTPPLIELPKDPSWKGPSYRKGQA